MSCAQRDRYLDGRLSLSEVELFARHLASCDACRHAEQEWREIEADLKDWGEARQAPSQDPDRFVAVIEGRRDERRRGQRRLAALAVAACLVLGLSLSLHALRQEPDSGWQAELLHREGNAVISCCAPTAETGGPSSGQELRVLGAGRLVARLGVDEVAIGAGSTLVIEEAQGPMTRLRLEAGSMAARVSARSAEGSFVVAAGDYSVRVVGTRFRVERPAGGGLIVGVDEGLVEVGAPGRTWWIEAGSALRIAPDGSGSVEALDVEARDAVRALLHPETWVLRPAVLQPEVPEIQDPDTSTDATGSPPPPALVPRPEPLPEPLPGLDALRLQILDGDPAGAAEGLEQRVARRPDDATAWTLLATVRRKLGDPDGAIEAWRRAAAVGSGATRIRARYEAAVLLQAGERHEEAVSELRALLDAPGGAAVLEPEALLRLATSLDALAQTDEASATLTDLIRRFPGTAPAEAAAARLRQDSL